jgi:biopolymer transport protein ExbD
MDAAMMNVEENQRLRVSITTRLFAMVAFTIPLIGGALSSFTLMSVFKALRSNETAGLGAIMAGMKEASLPAIISLYLAAVFAFVVIVVLVVRMFVQTKTASPPFWYFVLGGILCLLPAAAFWKAQLLVFEVLSPGSTIGAAGISGVAADLSQLLWMSIIAAPIVFVVLLVASVVPLSSRPGRKVGSLIVATVVALSFIATAVGVPFLIDGPKRKNELVALPANVKTTESDRDGNIEKESAMVLTLTADNKLYQRQTREVEERVERTETVITKEELPAKITTAMEGKTPDNRVVYLKCDVNAPYETVLQVFAAIRKADVDRVGLVVVGEKTVDDKYQIAPVSFLVQLQEPFNMNVIMKPNPLTLVAAIDKDGKVSINNEPKGTIADASRIETTLKNIFKDREDNGIFREGTNEIEKKTYIKVAKSCKYGDFIKLVETVKTAKASPIGIQIDDVN